MEKIVKELTKDIEILKKQNKELQYEIQTEKLQRIEMSVVLVDILKTLKKHNIVIKKEEEKIEEVLDDSLDLDLTQNVNHTSSVKQSLATTIVDTPVNQSLATTIVDTPVTKIVKDEIKEKEKMVSTIVDDFDILSDNEDLEEEVKPTINTEPETEMSKPPLPSNLITSPITPKEEEAFEEKVMLVGTKWVSNYVVKEEVVEEVKEEVVEEVKEEVVEEEDRPVINYKKIKVPELKRMCKKAGFKGYSKLKKQELINLLTK